MWCALRRLKGRGRKVASEMLERAAIPPRAVLDRFQPLARLRCPPSSPSKPKADRRRLFAVKSTIGLAELASPTGLGRGGSARDLVFIATAWGD
jgi:hypothetical protein